MSISREEMKNAILKGSGDQDSFNFDLKWAARAPGSSDIGEIAITSYQVGGLDDNAATNGAGVPPHTPEWTDLNPADPGVSLPSFDDWTI